MAATALRASTMRPCLCPERHLLLGPRLDLISEPTVMVEERRKVEGMGEAERMPDGPGQLARFLGELAGLIRAPEVPQGEREVTPVGHAGVVTGVHGPGL